MENFTPTKGIILRIEDIRGYGPYTDAPMLAENKKLVEHDSLCWEYPWHVGTDCPCDPIKHPTWLSDNFIPRIKDLGSHWHQYKFGFGTVDQYLNWFYTLEARAMLAKHNFKLNLYMSERGFVSPTQVLFLPGKRLPWPYEAEQSPIVFDNHPACIEKIADMQYAAA